MRALLIKFILWLGAAMPLRAVHVLGAAGGWALARLPSEARRVSRINIARCLPQMDAADRERLVFRSLIETGKTAAETGPLWRWDQRRIDSLVRGVEGESALDAALGAGRGAILAMPHLGAWELTALYSSLRHRMTSLYRPPRLRGLDAMMTAARERFGATLVPADTAGVRALLKALRRGELLGILPDQEPGFGSGVFSPFFGRPAYTMTLLARLVQQTGAPVFISYAERLAAGAGFRLHFLPLMPVPGASVEEITAAVNTGIEACVRSLPQQYQWSYKRFKTRPAGETRFYTRRAS
ncbi:MAG: lysophospholipid acyltransferase family protein [Gammaproteobacteria bacterium]